MNTKTSDADFIWKNAADLWENFKCVGFGKVILLFTLLRRLERVLEATRDQEHETVKKMKDSGVNLDVILRAQTT
jgi:type I restriction enzyme M protein